MRRLAWLRHGSEAHAEPGSIFVWGYDTTVDDRLFLSYGTHKNSPRTTISNSVDAGLASHENPMTLNMLANMSPSMAGGDECAGKYAKNLNRAKRDRHRRSACTVVPLNHANALAFAAARALAQEAEEGIWNME